MAPEACCIVHGRGLLGKQTHQHPSTMTQLVPPDRQQKGAAQKQIHVLRRRSFGRRRGVSDAHTPPAGL